jgi:hypothetical protein
MISISPILRIVGSIPNGTGNAIVEIGSLGESPEVGEVNLPGE